MIVEKDFFRKKTNPATDVHLLRGLNDANDQEHWTVNMVKRGDCLISVGLTLQRNWSNSGAIREELKIRFGLNNSSRAIRAFFSLTECKNSL